MNRVVSNKVYESIQPYTSYNSTSGKIIYANKYADTAPVEMSQELKKLLDSDVGLNGTNLLIQLRNKFMFMPNGPWYVDSRDGVIYIHNRKFQEAPVHTYTYQNENGEVLRIQFQTNWVTKSTKVVLHEVIDPVTKNIEATKTDIEDENVLPPFPLKPVDGVIDNTMWSNDMTSFHVEDYHTHPSNAGGASQLEYVRDVVNKRYQEDREYMQKVAKDPNLGLKDAQDKIIGGLDSKSTQDIINLTVKDKDFPDNTRRQLTMLINDYERAKDPKTYVATLQQILEGVYYQRTAESSIKMCVDPLNYDRADVISNSPGYVYHNGYLGTSNYTDTSVAQKRWSNLDKMKNDPNIIVLSVEKDQNTVNYGPSRVWIVRKGDNDIKVPLFRLYQNLFGRLGGADTYLWAMNANKNGGLKSKEKQLRVNMTVVGRPMLTASMVINIQNIGRKYSGPWYVKRCTHKMNIGSGYLCELELVKNSGMAGSSTSRVSLSSQNVLHVYTDQNGKTTYGKKDPNEETASKFMATFNKQEISFYALGAYSGKRDAIRDIAVKLAYNEKYANDPYKLQAGTVRTKEVVTTNDGVTTMGTYQQIDVEKEGISERVEYYDKQLRDSKAFAGLKQSTLKQRARLALEAERQNIRRTQKEKVQDAYGWYLKNLTGGGVIYDAFQP